MKGKFWFAVVVPAVVIAGAAVVAVTARRPEWTTSSPEALAEFLQGQDALDKVYKDEAHEHFAKAAALDPGFVAAKLFVYGTLDGPAMDTQGGKILEELAAADPTKLTEREAFLIRYALADKGKIAVKPEVVLDGYAGKHPDDPFVLNLEVGIATAHQNWPEARRLLTRLIEVAPNRVSAYNDLGYLAMGQGRFAESEKMFQTYRYIAPDQANPHDSLGELLILVGRYAEARKELEEALRIKPDFCASYGHLVNLAEFEEKPDLAEDAIQRAQNLGKCTGYALQLMRCEAAVRPPALARDWEGIWKASEANCVIDPKEGPTDIVALWAALMTGRRDAVAAREERLHAQLAKAGTGGGKLFNEALLAHLEGARLLMDGNLAEAAARFRFADQGFSYRELPLGSLKMFNRLALARTLQLSGVADEAAAELEEVRSVNPDFAGPVMPLLATVPGR